MEILGGECRLTIVGGGDTFRVSIVVFRRVERLERGSSDLRLRVVIFDDISKIGMFEIRDG